MIVRSPIAFMAAFLALGITAGVAVAEDGKSGHYNGPEFVRKIPGFRLLFGDYALTEEEYDALYGKKRPRNFDEKYYEPETAAPSKSKKKQAAKPAKAPASAGTKSAATGNTASTSPAPAKAADSEGISCEKATSIVSGYGFSGVSAESCKGKVYAFNATRDGKKFAVKLNAASGELTEVKKLP
jgi:hypothetical protein